MTTSGKEIAAAETIASSGEATGARRPGQPTLLLMAADRLL
jgi:hypothetical protein